MRGSGTRRPSTERKKIDENLLARPMRNIRCFLCKRPSSKYFFHVIERVMKDRRPLPFPRGMEFFVVKDKKIWAGFPVCVKCTQPCRRCGLARVNGEVRKDFAEIYKEWNNRLDKIFWGKGICACGA